MGVDDEREFGVGFGDFGKVQPDGNGGLGRDDGVSGYDVGFGVVGGRNKVMRLVPVNLAGAVDPEERAEVVSDLGRVGLHGSAE